MVVLTALKTRLVALWRRPWSRVALAAAVVVPVLLVVLAAAVAGAAFDATDRIPVALVNQDTGTQGEDLVDDLLDSEQLAWNVVSEKKAKAGLEDGSFALELRIPEDYSAKLDSLDGDDPQKATLELVSSGTGNVLATNAGSAVVRQVQSRLKSQVGENYLLSVLNDVRGQATKLTMTADGAVMLDEGFDALSQGADALGSGLSQIASGAGQLGSGLTQIATGADALGMGAGGISTGLDMVRVQAVAPLAQGAGALAAGLDAASSGASTLSLAFSAHAQVAAGLEQAIGTGYDGLIALNGSGMAENLGTGIKDLNAALQSGNEALCSAMSATDNVSAAFGDANRDKLTAVEKGLSGLSDGLSSDAAEHPGAAQRVASIQGQVAGARDVLSSYLDRAGDSLSAEERTALEDALEDLDAAHEASQDLAADLTKMGYSARGLANDAGDVREGIDAASSAAGDLAASRKQLASSQVDAAKAAGAITSAMAQGQQGLATVSGSVAAAHGILDTYEKTTGMSFSASNTALAAGASTLAEQLGSHGVLGRGMAGIAAGVGALDQALAPFSTGAAQLGQGATALSQALSGVAQGASGLTQGLGAMASATGQLSAGVGQLKTASGKITDVMSAAGDALSSASSNREDRAEVAASAVALSAVHEGELPEGSSNVVYGATALALWLGCTALACLLPAFDGRAAFAGKRLRALAGPYSLYVLFGSVLAAILAVAGALAGAVPVESLPGILVMMVLAALAFTAVGQLFKVAFGHAGICIVAGLGALHLFCAGVVLPASMAPAPLQVLGGISPIALLARALQGLAVGLTSPVAPAAVVLGICLAGSAVLAYAHVRVRGILACHR